MLPELTGYLFPNDVHIHWSLMIVMYPYITGLVAGSFLVSSFYHVFGQKAFQPLARLALATSLCFLTVATFPLLNHLGHPERAVNIVIVSVTVRPAVTDRSPAADKKKVGPELTGPRVPPTRVTPLIRMPVNPLPEWSVTMLPPDSSKCQPASKSTSA